MKAELRAVFPELFVPSGSVAALTSTSTGASAGSAVSPALLTSEQQFKALPLLAIPTFQKAALPLIQVSPQVEQEKNKLLESVRRHNWHDREAQNLRHTQLCARHATH
jgi:hypothetical protein